MKMGDIIKSHRIRLGLTQEELGAKLGVNKAAVQKWERGTVENIKRSNIKILAEIFQIPPSELMGWEQTQPNFDDRYCSDELADEVCLIEKIQNFYGKDAVQLLQSFMELNELGKEKALENISDLGAIPKYINEDEGLMYRAARSKDHTAPQVMKKSKEKISKLENAPKVTNSDDL